MNYGELKKIENGKRFFSSCSNNKQSLVCTVYIIYCSCLFSVATKLRFDQGYFL